MIESVLIIGAGVAGLSAAGELAKAGIRPLVLEARSRAGGRIHTLSQIDSTPIELGAEFLHGKSPITGRFAREHHLASRLIADEHWRVDGGEFQPLEDFWGQLSQIFGKLPEKGKDQTYCEFLEATRGVPSEASALATDFVEGFHAGDPERISSLSIAQSEAASEKINGTKQFRFVAGYGELVRALVATAKAHGARFQFGCAISRIECKAQRVAVSGRCGDELLRWDAKKVLVTLPLGVLQSGSVNFDPPLFPKEEAVRILAMGNVVKVNLELRPGLWPDNKEGFVHFASEYFPTWWRNGNVVTAWVGGPRADALAKHSSAEIMQAVIDGLANMFGMDSETAHGYVASAQYHDWRRDPFARGAYSYVPVGAVDARKSLASPVRNTLFFAGEATAQPGFQGTVHGAAESGVRAAREILRG